MVGGDSTDFRVVPCEACGSEGRLYERHTWYDREYGYQDGEEDTGPCPYCEGTGGELIEVEPIEMEDLDMIGGGQ